MGYLVAFGLVLFGYTLIDWGHYIRRHENVSVWYLISGMGDKYNAGSAGRTPGGTSGLRSSLGDVVNAQAATTNAQASGSGPSGGTSGLRQNLGNLVSGR